MDKSFYDDVDIACFWIRNTISEGLHCWYYSDDPDKEWVTVGHDGIKSEGEEMPPASTPHVALCMLYKSLVNYKSDTKGNTIYWRRSPDVTRCSVTGQYYATARLIIVEEHY